MRIKPIFIQVVVVLTNFSLSDRSIDIYEFRRLMIVVILDLKVAFDSVGCANL